MILATLKKIERLPTEWQEDNLIPQEFWSQCYYSLTIHFPRIEEHGSQFRWAVLKSAPATVLPQVALKTEASEVSVNLFHARGSVCVLYKTSVNCKHKSAVLSVPSFQSSKAFNWRVINLELGSTMKASAFYSLYVKISCNVTLSDTQSHRRIAHDRKQISPNSLV
jgi:hypothetical protein